MKCIDIDVSVFKKYPANCTAGLIMFVIGACFLLSFGWNLILGLIFIKIALLIKKDIYARAQKEGVKDDQDNS